MARTIARVNTTNKSLDRLLTSLENRLDKETAHVRRYYQDLKDIRTLLENDKIDRQHAELWASKAKKALQETESKLRKKQGKRSHPAYPLPPRPVPNISWFKRVFGP